METEELIILVSVVAGVLQIVLFFKLWVMTNDVKKLRETLTSERAVNFKFEVRKLLCSGNKEKAKELLLNRFYKELSVLNYAGLDKGASNYAQVQNNIDSDFNKLKAEFEKQCTKIGVEVPEDIKNMKSGNEFYELFV